MPRERSSRARRRSSSVSSDSSYDRRRSKKKSKKRSRSRDRSHSSSISRSRRSRRSYSRSVSRDRYDSKSSRRKHKKSSRRSSSYERSRRGSRERRKSRSHSRDRDVKRSSNKKKSKKSDRSHGSSSSPATTTNQFPQKKFIVEEPTEKKLEKAIKAAEAAGLTMTKMPSFEVQAVDVKEEMPTIQDRNLLNEINSDSFVQKKFKSSKAKKKNETIVLNLNDNSIKLPDIEKVVKEDELLDLSVFPSENELREVWVKKIYQFRKKVLRGEL